MLDETESDSANARLSGAEDATPPVSSNNATAVEPVKITLDDEHSAKLRRLAERMHTNPETIAGSLLSSALDDAEPDARYVSELLDAISEAFERAQHGREEAREGLGTPLEGL